MQREKRSQGLNGERLARHFGIRATSTFSVTRASVPPLVITHLQGETSLGAPTELRAPEAAYSIVLQLQLLQHHELKLGGRATHSGPVPAGAVSAISLTDLPSSRMRGTFDGLQFYVPKSFLNDVADEEGFARPAGLSWPRAQPDPIALLLVGSLIPAIQELDAAGSLFVDHIVLAFLCHAARRYGQVSVVRIPARSGLAPWQERRAKELLRARLAASLTIRDVSRECRLTPSYFAAAFKRSTGQSPHQFLSELRVVEAKNLLRQSSLPLSDIGLMCGFSDQSHFTRTFSRLVGVSPGQWRRMKTNGPLDPDTKRC